MLESSQEYLMEAEEEKPAEGKESLKDKAAKMGASISTGAGKMIDALIAFATNLWSKIKGAFFALIAKGDKSWDALAVSVAKKEKVSVVKDSGFGEAALGGIKKAKDLAETDTALKAISELTGTKEEVSGSEAATLIKARKAMVAGEAKAMSGFAEGHINSIKAKITAEKGKDSKDGAAISALKKELSETGMMYSKKVSGINQMNAKLFSASK